MKPKDPFQASSKFVPILIVLPYVIVSFLWVYYSNTILVFLVHDHRLLLQLLNLKGFLYVIFTAAVSYLLFYFVARNIIQSERKYRHLFENAPAAIWEEDFSGLKEFLDKQRALGVSDWREYFEENPQAVKECASLVKILDFNREGEKVLGVKNKENVPRNLDYYFNEATFENFKEDLIALATGATQRKGMTSARYANGEPMDLMYQINIVPGYEKDFSKVLLCLQDITNRKKLEDALAFKEQRLRQIIDLVPHFIFAKDIEGRFVLVNRNIAEFYGTTVEDLIGKKDEDFVKSRKEVQHFLQDDLEVIRSGKPKFIPQETITNAKGQVKILSTTKIPFTCSGTGSPCILGVAVDITEYKSAEDALSQSRHFVDSVLDSSPDLIYVYDLINQKNVYCNHEVIDYLGYTAKQVRDLGERLFADLLHPEDLPKVIEHHQMLTQEGDVREIEYRMKASSGQWRWLRSRDVLFSRTPQGDPWQILGSAVDITDQKHLENEILTLSYYDTLTAFPNRTLFFERANLGLSNTKRSTTSCAVLLVDLDRFKTINDTLGHSVGDELLKDTAMRIGECVREGDTIARLGGDKFIIFLNGLEGPQRAQYIAERIREKLNTPRQIVGNDLFITASIGIATYPNDGENLEDLLKNADVAMYAAKEAGRNTFCFFDGKMNAKAVSRMQIERGLRDSLVKNEFKLFYQPIIGVQDGRVRGFEALLRWFRADGVLVYPNDFISIAEETGLIVSIGEWVLQEACRMGRKLQDLGFVDSIMSVNISVAQLRDRDIINVIRKALEQAGLSAGSLEIEVTESVFIGSFDTPIEILKEIREMGVKVSLDDFGTGYSSLSHLQRLPITSLKIDRLFIKELMNEEGGEMAMTATIIGLAHALNLGVIAEGVEHDLQLKSLAHENCDYFQGFLFGKPMHEERAIAFLEENCS